MHPSRPSVGPLRRKVRSLRPGPTSRTTSAATGRCSGRRSRLGFLIAGYVSLLPHRTSSTRSSSRHAPGAVACRRERARRADRRGARRSSARSGTCRSRPCSGRAGSRSPASSRSSSPTCMILPIVAYYGKVYGRRFAALLVGIDVRRDRRRGARRRRAVLGCSGSCRRSGRRSLDHRAPRDLELHVVPRHRFAVVFVALIALTLRRGATRSRVRDDVSTGTPASSTS